MRDSRPPITFRDSSRGPRRVATQAADHLFLAVEASRPTAYSARHTLENIDEVVIGRGETRSSKRLYENGVRRLLLTVPDSHMSTRHARLLRRAGAWELLDCGSTNGSWLAGRRITEAALEDGALLELGYTFFIFRTGMSTPADALGDSDAAELSPSDPAFCTLLPELAQRFSELSRMARSQVAVLVHGETGAGKEWLARAVHARSGRAGAFIGVNCAALPAPLLEAQLFGHVKGAFSGADRTREGLIHAAHGGTLLLDEIADLALPAQAALLRVLQEREVTPIGSTRPVPVDLRIVAATHADLEDRVKRELFREDLLARLSGFVFRVPSLRERREDLGIFIASMLQEPAFRELGSKPPRLHPELVRALLGYAWPRNIRELRQELLSAAVLSGSERMQLAHVKEALRPVPAVIEPTHIESELDPAELALRAQLEAELHASGGNLTEVARRMGKARNQIQRWMKRLRLDRHHYGSHELQTVTTTELECRKRRHTS